MLLPEGSMPWGRWSEGETLEHARQIELIRNDASSVGSQFAARADGIASQIAGLNSRSIQEITIPTFSRSISPSSPPDYRSLESPVITINPPANSFGRVAIIVNYDVNDSDGDYISRAGVHINKINGVNYGGQGENVDNSMPPPPAYMPPRSSMADAEYLISTPVTYQFGFVTYSLNPATVTFSNVRVWAAFSGRQK